MPEAALPYAELIGDPVSHSKSPAIHNFWLQTLGIAGDYRATRVRGSEVGTHLAARRGDPLWRGCNVTAPHKQIVIPYLDRLHSSAERVGAVNCILQEEAILTGFNTDVDGVLHALAGTDLHHGKAVIIGSGGGARAATAALQDSGAAEIILLTRCERNMIELSESNYSLVQLQPLTEATSAIVRAKAVINATPLGMADADPTPRFLLDALAGSAPGATVLDMVYAPLETPLLAAARAAGLRPVDGLTMLLGQARRAFELFFGRMPPDDDDAVRGAIASPRAGSRRAILP